MLYNQPYGGAADAPYVNGNPAIGLAGSIPPAASIEYPQREIVNAITDAGLQSPSNADLHQLARAVQSGLLNGKDDAGTANAYSVTLVPSPLTYFKYLTVVMKVTNSNTGASTINVNAMGAKNILHTDLTPLVAAEMLAGMMVCLVYDGTQFQLVWKSTAPTTGTVVLTSSRIFYVNGATGNDSNDGTAAVVGGGHGPWLTLQKAMDTIANYNLNGFDITINVADSTYTGGLRLKAMAGSGNVFWIGNATTPANVHISTTNKIAMSGTDVGKSHNLTGFKFSSATGGSPVDEMAGIAVQGVTTLILIDCEFGACVAAQMQIHLGARIRYSGKLRVTGGATACVHCAQGGIFDSINTSPPTIALNFIVPITYSIAFIYCSILGISQMILLSTTSGGNVTGTRFRSDLNSVINSAGGGLTYYPGTIAGVAVTGLYA